MPRSERGGNWEKEGSGSEYILNMEPSESPNRLKMRREKEERKAAEPVPGHHGCGTQAVVLAPELPCSCVFSSHCWPAFPSVIPLINFLCA